MFPEKEEFKPQFNPREEAPEKKEGESEIAEEVSEAPIKELIDAILDLPAKDIQLLYEALSKVIKPIKKEPAKEAPAREMPEEDKLNAEDMARSFM